MPINVINNAIGSKSKGGGSVKPHYLLIITCTYEESPLPSIGIQITSNGKSQEAITDENGVVLFSYDEPGVIDIRGLEPAFHIEESITGSDEKETSVVIKATAPIKVTFPQCKGFFDEPLVGTEISFYKFKKAQTADTPSVSIPSPPNTTLDAKYSLSGYEEVVTPITVADASIDANVVKLNPSVLQKIIFNISNSDGSSLKAGNATIVNTLYPSHGITSGLLSQVTFELPAGNYAYTITQTGLPNATGTFTVETSEITIEAVFPPPSIWKIARNESDYGLLFQAGKPKTGYRPSTEFKSAFDDPDIQEGEIVTKWPTIPTVSSQTFRDAETYRVPRFDPATLCGDGSWVTPTAEQMKAIADLSKSKVVIDSIPCVRITDGTSSITLPLAGYRDKNDGVIMYTNNRSFYWTANPSQTQSGTDGWLMKTGRSTNGSDFKLDSGGFDGAYQRQACSLRPVKKPGWIPPASGLVDCIELPTGSGIYWAKGNVDYY